MFSYKLIFISLSKTQKESDNFFISDRMRIEKDTTDKRLVQRYMYTF